MQVHVPAMALQEVYLRSARICRGSSVKRPVDGSCCSIEACTALPLWPPTANSCSCRCINTKCFRALCNLTSLRGRLVRRPQTQMAAAVQHSSATQQRRRRQQHRTPKLLVDSAACPPR